MPNGCVTPGCWGGGKGKKPRAEQRSSPSRPARLRAPQRGSTAGFGPSHLRGAAAGAERGGGGAPPGCGAPLGQRPRSSGSAVCPCLFCIIVIISVVLRTAKASLRGARCKYQPQGSPGTTKPLSFSHPSQNLWSRCGWRKPFYCVTINTPSAETGSDNAGQRG